MANLGNTTRPAYVYDAETDTWLPIGVGAHSHDYTTQFIGKTLVDAKGDIVTASASDTPAILSKGADGTILVADSSTSTGLAWQPYAAPSVAGKNILINGGLDIWQRYTAAYSGTPTANTIFYNGADRWFYATGTGSNSVTFSRVSAESTDAAYGIRFGRNAGATNTSAPTIIGQNIDSASSKRLSGKTVTLSFYAKTLSSFGNNLAIYLISGTGTDQSSQTIFGAGFTGATTPINLGESISTSMTRYTYTATVPSNSNQLAVMFALYVIPATAGSNEFVQLEKIQLEEGPIATTFSRAAETYQAELAACQRYYWRNTASQNYSLLGTGMANSSTNVQFHLRHPVEMRTAPTSIDYNILQSNDTATGVAISSMTFQSSETGTLNSTVNATTSGMTTYRLCKLLSSNTTAGYIGLSAEL